MCLLSTKISYTSAFPRLTINSTKRQAAVASCHLTGAIKTVEEMCNVGTGKIHHFGKHVMFLDGCKDHTTLMSV